MQTTLASYRLITRDLDKSLARTAAEKPVALETRYYQEHIGSVKSIDDFLNDTRLFKYAMNAFGLGDMAYAKGMMRKVLEGGVADAKSFANKLSDDRFVAFATTFDFAAKGETTTASTDAQQGVVDRYVRQQMETEAGEDDDALRLALYFQRLVPTVKSAYGLLADPALWKVVQTIFQLPDGMAADDVDKQAKAITDRLNLADLQDPAKLDRLITRFTTMAEISEPQNAPILTLFDTSSAQQGISEDLLMTVASLKHGGS
jgi:hypothetical protein